MENRLKWLEHKGHKILYVDYSKMKGVEIADFSNGPVSELYLTLPEDRETLILVNCTNAFANTQAMEALKKSNSLLVNRLKRGAVFEVSKVQKTLLNLLNKFTRVPFEPFSTQEDALEYLIVDE